MTPKIMEHVGNYNLPLTCCTWRKNDQLFVEPFVPVSQLQTAVCHRLDRDCVPLAMKAAQESAVRASDQRIIVQYQHL